jgi:tryptophanyl-tRNA synthetase
MKDVILTGIRANNDLHIGNYFGAMLPIIDMAKSKADQYQVNMFIPDLHSFTTPVEFGKPLHDAIMNNARVFAAAGLPFDNDNINLYRQSYVPAHSEMTWILDCFTGFGQMGRMIQFKEKSSATDKETRRLFDYVLREKYPELKDAIENAEDDIYEKEFHDKLFDVYSRVADAINESKRDNVSVGLFNYPVLMAADILLYGAKYVPVGEDQTQHLEFTRDIAERMNSKFGELFVVPESVKKQHEFFGKDQGLRIKDLLDPSKKMSKSDETGNGVIFLSDSPEEATKKIMRATTDSEAHVRYNKETQPGIANLIDILALLRNAAPAEVAAQYEGMEKYGEFKSIVAEEMAKFLADFQQNLANVDDTAVLAKLEKSETAMNAQANETLLRVQKAVGLRA